MPSTLLVAMSSSTARRASRLAWISLRIAIIYRSGRAGQVGWGGSRLPIVVPTSYYRRHQPARYPHEEMAESVAAGLRPGRRPGIIRGDSTSARARTMNRREFLGVGASAVLLGGAMA